MQAYVLPDHIATFPQLEAQLQAEAEKVRGPADEPTPSAKPSGADSAGSRSKPGPWGPSAVAGAASPQSTAPVVDLLSFDGPAESGDSLNSFASPAEAGNFAATSSFDLL